MGSSFEGGREIATAKEIIEGFSLDRTGKGGAVFDEEKLLWLNGIHIRRFEAAVLVERLTPFIREAGYDECSFGPERLDGIVAAVRDSLPTLADIGGLLEIFSDDRFRMEEAAASLLKGDDAKKVLAALGGHLDAGGAPGKDEADSVAIGAGLPLSFAELIKQIGEQAGFRGKKLYLPIRAALTGRLHGPEMDRIFALLSPTILRKRVEKALALN
jgi:nondiscriminating glutamyl-tRNA synthetase